MALLPDDPKKRQQTFLLVGLLLVAVGYLYREYVLKPRQEEIARLEQRVESLVAQNDRAKRLAQRFGTDLSEKVKLYERQLQVLEEFIPRDQEVPALLEAVATQAQLSGVDLSRIRPASVEPGAYYDKYTYELAVIGEYHDVGRYLARIGSLPRIIRPRNVNVTPAPQQARKEGSVAPVQTTFVIETFVMPKAPAPTAPAASSDG